MRYSCALFISFIIIMGCNNAIQPLTINISGPYHVYNVNCDREIDTQYVYWVHVAPNVDSILIGTDSAKTSYYPHAIVGSAGEGIFTSVLIDHVNFGELSMNKGQEENLYFYHDFHLQYDTMRFFFPFYVGTGLENEKTLEVVYLQDQNRLTAKVKQVVK